MEKKDGKINLFFDDKGDELQNIIDNLILEIYKAKFLSNCNMPSFRV